MNNQKEELKLIPCTERYIQYVLEVLQKIHLSKWLYYLNKIDAELNIQRSFLRIMYKNRWIDCKKFNVAIGLISEIGKIIGGLIKYYAKNNTKSI